MNLKRNSKIRFILAVLVAALAGYTVGVTKIDIDFKNYQPKVEIASKEPPASVTQVDFSPMWQVLSQIEQNYYDKNAIDAQKILNGAIQGMVASLDDPYTVYLPPQENTDFKQGLAGKFEGIGAELGMRDNQIIIVAPLDGSPAKAAGVGVEDAILSVDNKSTAGWTLREAVDRIRGPKGTEVMLTLLAAGSNQPRDVKIVRDTITLKSLTSWTKSVKDIEGIEQTNILKNAADKKIIYIRLSQFGDTTNGEWLTLANELDRKLKEDGSIEGVVFDLRNNPGGYLNDAVYIVSEFVKSGTAVMQEDREGDRREFKVSGKGLLTNVPLVVLINKGSASASEIVAGAIRDNDRGVLVGTASFGKGTIQQADDLGGGAGLHVTIAKWLTPDGTWVGNGKDGDGLVPDIEVDLPEDPDILRDTQLELAIEELIK